MGYYDDHYRSKKGSKRSSWLLPAIVGLVIGAFLFAFALPALVKMNILPYNIIVQEGGAGNNINQSNGDGQSNIDGNAQSINVDVSSQITDVVSKVAPAVVGVANIQSQTNFWEQEQSGEAGTGSGVVYKIENDRAFVVTNHHVIEGADQVEIILSDETRVSAELIGSDLFTDLAVLEMDSSYVEKVVEIGNSDNVKVGEPAIAIGNPLGLYLSGSVTQGIISGKQRAIPQDFDMDGRADWQAEVIQTDAAINPGNSGGALINMSGQLIGINSMKIAQSSVEGIGFAIPVDDAVPIINELEQEGKITRPYLGVEAYSLNDIAQVEWERSLNLPGDVEGGIYIRTIEQMSPADQAGLEPYDVITQLDGEKIKNIIDLRKHLYQVKEIGEEMKVTYYRDGEQKELTVQLASLEY